MSVFGHQHGKRRFKQDMHAHQNARRVLPRALRRLCAIPLAPRSAPRPSPLAGHLLREGRPPSRAHDPLGSARAHCAAVADSPRRDTPALRRDKTMYLNRAKLGLEFATRLLNTVVCKNAQVPKDLTCIHNWRGLMRAQTTANVQPVRSSQRGVRGGFVTDVLCGPFCAPRAPQ